ncbi:MAG: FKBP-type peptidyl-prolyl cis-trans isomerase [Bacteroidetes bacterium]|nr:FKBP-type peptidyl-prolyl cis-trans isomerase [Bacteroidota bacterium]
MIPKLFAYQLMIFAVLFVSCNTDNKSDKNNDSNQNNPQLKKESLIKTNRYLVNSENTEINNYIRRHNLDVVETGSGLRYKITKHGEGEMAQKGKVATLNYKVKLITGDVIYTSDKTGHKEFEIGHGGVESGLEEAILHMKVGDHAIIIIPSHLAFGLLGDNKNIPPRSTIIYEIEFTNIN